MTNVLLPLEFPCMPPVADNGWFKDASAAPARNDWQGVSVRQRSPDTPLPRDPETMETLRASITSGLREIGNDWAAMARELRCDLAVAPLPEAFGELSELIASVKSHQVDGPDSIDRLMLRFETAIARIYRSRQAPWGSWRSVGGQRHATDHATLTPNAKAALSVLTELDRAVAQIRLTARALRRLDVQSRTLRGSTRGKASKRARAQLAAAFDAAGLVLRVAEPHIENFLAKAEAAIPPERRRWKTKIAILLGLALVTASLGIASMFLPPMLPALVGLGLGLKIGATATGLMATGNGIFSIVGYTRNPGWSELAECIKTVEHLHRDIHREIETHRRYDLNHEQGTARRVAVHFNDDITTASSTQTRVVEQLDHLGGALGSTTPRRGK